jgi:hypothetical protein
MAAILSTILLAGSALAQDFIPTPVRRQAAATASPLTDYHYSYSNVPYQVKFVSSSRFVARCNLMRNDVVLSPSAVAPKQGTTSATVPPKGQTPSARLCLSTPLMVC